MPEEKIEPESEPRPALVVGECYRGWDNTVRWIIHKSTRGYLHCLWLDETRKVWFDGGKYKADKFPRGEKTEDAPKPGESYTLMGPYGTPTVRVMPEPKKGSNP